VSSGLRVRQGTFSYLPDLSDDEIKAQLQYGIDHGWAVAVEVTDEPHPRNVYWEMWGMPMFDIQDPAAAFYEVRRCREAFPDHYVRVSLYNPTMTKMTTALQFLVHRPPREPGFRLDRQEAHDRVIRYALQTNAAERPRGKRSGNGLRS
jgi:ribulose-bisphosphate carboxylase small chain